MSAWLVQVASGYALRNLNQPAKREMNSYKPNLTNRTDHLLIKPDILICYEQQKSELESRLQKRKGLNRVRQAGERPENSTMAKDKGSFKNAKLGKIVYRQLKRRGSPQPVPTRHQNPKQPPP